MASLDSKLVNVVGDRTAKVLDSVFGYKTLSDLIHHYPRRYLVRGELSDIAELKEGDEVTVLAEIFSSTSRKLHARKGSILEVIVTDGSAKCRLPSSIKLGVRKNYELVGKVYSPARLEYLITSAN